ncbi:MAG: hypothetical protein ABI410_13485 [Rhodoferax sp.]|uniref:hypothetical protein n=1 Tax=Rhodoferax sp. TaxID=50421 RepID=UPI003266FEC7
MPALELPAIAAQRLRGCVILQPLTQAAFAAMGKEVAEDLFKMSEELLTQFA